MPVVKTTSPTACPSPPQTSPSKRAPSSRSTYPVAAAHHRISLCTALNSGVPARSSSSNSGGLHRPDDRARALHALEAALVVDLVARADGVGGHVDLDALGRADRGRSVRRTRASRCRKRSPDRAPRGRSRPRGRPRTRSSRSAARRSGRPRARCGRGLSGTALRRAGESRGCGPPAAASRRTRPRPRTTG